MNCINDAFDINKANKRKYMDKDKQSFSLLCIDRTLDMVVDKQEDFQAWQAVLKSLLEERTEADLASLFKD